MGWTHHERRVFQRVATNGLPLEFDVLEPAGWRRFTRRTALAAQVLDVSVSGAQILVVSRDCPRQASVIAIRHAGAIGKVLVRWSAPGPGDETWLFGVEYLELDPELREYLGSPIDERRGQLRHYQFTSPVARASKFT